MKEYLELHTTTCQHCCKCIRNCPVKAISYAEHQANIMQNECILCGRCFVACPQNAKSIRSDVETAKELLKSGAKVYASLAPSFVANYPGVNINEMRKALQALGFYDAKETALGATMVKERYDEMVRTGEQRVLLSSCCHTINMLIQRHFPAALPYLAPVVTPMFAHCDSIKRQDPAAKTVFIGPCISKKAEAEEYTGVVDCVLTFNELSRWMEQEAVCPKADHSMEKMGRTRLFPSTGGILNSMYKENPDYSYIAVDGIENCITAIRDVIDGNLNNCFIELSACAGSCIAGPAMENAGSIVRNYAAIQSAASQEDFPVSAGRDELRRSFSFSSVARPHISGKDLVAVMKKMGKTKPEDELNCGSCGYDTCREKAEAVLLGKADLNMCLPYLMGKAASFSDTIIQNTPNAIVVLNEALEIHQMNKAACTLTNVKRESDVLGKKVVCILDPGPFLDVLESGRNLYEKRVYLSEYSRYVMQTVVFDKTYDLLICLMRDVTSEEYHRAEKKEMNDKTIDIANKVIEKQMRTVQEIASLLGETTAETQVALTRLKEGLQDE